MTPRQKYLLKTYGITVEQYRSLLRKQKGRCPVCLRRFKDIPRSPHIDHNHKTGEIRGILCAYCNHRVVGRHTDHEIISRVAAYLQSKTGWIVPKKKRKR